MNKIFLLLAVIGVNSIQCSDKVETVSEASHIHLKKAETTAKNIKKFTADDCKAICCGPSFWMGLGFICIKKLFESAGN